jgi:hypothetical protein
LGGKLRHLTKEMNRKRCVVGWGEWDGMGYRHNTRRLGLGMSWAGEAQHGTAQHSQLSTYVALLALRAADFGFFLYLLFFPIPPEIFLVLVRT